MEIVSSRDSSIDSKARGSNKVCVKSETFSFEIHMFLKYLQFLRVWELNILLAENSHCYLFRIRGAQDYF